MPVQQLRDVDFINLLRVAPILAKLPTRRIVVDYDDEADVLYISFERPQKATASDMRDDGIIVHRRGKQVVGITILDASTRS
ncbi:MAG: DUF2283 domain-containing protein [Phycisphaerales bacterium]|nr:MAG: DUF2283 domain-containing protein [Phycisphaerales bacterium]